LDNRVYRERRQVARHLRRNEHRADDRRDVCRDGLLGWFDLESEAEEDDVFFGEEPAIRRGLRRWRSLRSLNSAVEYDRQHRRDERRDDPSGAWAFGHINGR